MNNPLTKQVGGSHYKKVKIQPIEYILANGLAFCEGNIVKYVTRWRDKDGVKDLQKIIHYAEFLIEEHEREQREKSSEAAQSCGQGPPDSQV